MNKKLLENIFVGTCGFFGFMFVFMYFFKKNILSSLKVGIPYLVIWIIFEIYYNKKTGKYFIAFTQSNFFKNDLYKKPNYTYAILMFVIYVIVFLVQMLFGQWG